MNRSWRNSRKIRNCTRKFCEIQPIKFEKKSNVTFLSSCAAVTLKNRLPFIFELIFQTQRFEFFPSNFRQKSMMDAKAIHNKFSCWKYWNWKRIEERRREKVWYDSKNNNKLVQLSKLIKFCGNRTTQRPQRDSKLCLFHDFCRRDKHFMGYIIWGEKL